MKLLRVLLAPLAPLYGAIVRSRNSIFSAHPERAASLETSVISIGNLSSGGTGKTPLTLFLAQSLEERGFANMILSRGYGGRRKIDPMDVFPDSDPAMTGDEPLMMARRLGAHRVIVGRKRHAAGLRGLARYAAAQNSSRLNGGDHPSPVMLLDDGFQHRGLKRDLDLLLLDGVHRWGNGKMLPLGDLREPMEGAKRAHALVVTRGSRAPKEEVLAWWAHYGSGGPVFWVDFAISALRNFHSGQKLSKGCMDALFAFCALGHPEAYFADLLLAGYRWVGTRSYRDHQRVTRPMLLAMQQEALALGASGLVCTEKDAVKFTSSSLEGLQMPLFVAEQAVEGAADLLDFVVSELGKKPNQA